MFLNILTGNHKNILGINKRNLHFVYPGMKRSFFKIADEKLLAKELFQRLGVPTPLTMKVFERFGEIRNIENVFHGMENIVIKPNCGSGGFGIMVLGKQSENGFFDVKGNLVTFKMLKKHLADVLLGVYSHGMSDKVFIEERIIAHDFLRNIYDQGLADIRIIVYKNKPVMGMLRIPTSFSGGKANLHQGGIGIGLDIETGITTTALFKGSAITKHPDSGITLSGLQIPDFPQLLNYSESISREVPLKYIGFDFTIDQKIGPMLIEINARPGLAIQIANQKGLLEVLK